MRTSSQYVCLGDTLNASNMDNHTEKQGGGLKASLLLFIVSMEQSGYMVAFCGSLHNYILQSMYKEMGTDEYYGQDITLNVLGLSSTH